MALISQLVSLLEAHRVDAGPTLTLTARRLREAGRLSQSGRGRGAAHATHLDAARLLIALAGTDRPERAVDVESVLSGMVRTPPDGAAQPDEAFQMNPDLFPTLDGTLAETLRALGEGEAGKAAAARREHYGPAPVHCWLRLWRDASNAEIRFLDGRYRFQHPALAAVVRAPDHVAQTAAVQEFERATNRFRTGKHLTAEFDGELLKSVADLIARRSK